MAKIKTLVLICFFLSGLTGLIYEILWTRMIVKIIGGAPFAVSIILTVFMGGLGLGSYIASRFIGRVKEPVELVKIYGWLELAIGVYGLVLPLLLVAFGPFYAIVYNQLFDHFLLYNLLIFAGCIAALFFPVICMGATLPILCQYYITNLSQLGSHAGRLYGLNTIGAAFGALLCGFWLINLLGVWGTLILAILINMVIGFFCIMVSYKTTSGQAIGKKRLAQTKKSPLPKQSEETAAVKNPGTEIGALVIFGVSGFCAMAYEVLWAKLLGLIVGPTTYSFTIVLVTFILGLALGSMFFGWVGDRTGRLLQLLIATQIGAGLAALGASQFLGNSQLFFAKVIHHFEDQFALLSLVKAILLFAFMIVPTLFLGATFPLVGKIVTRSVSKIGKSIGIAYTVNTIGAVSGSFCAGFVLIPLIGKESGLSLVVGLQLIVALIIASIELFKHKNAGWRSILLAAPALAGLIFCLYLPEWNHSLLARGKYHRFYRMEADIESYGWLESLLKGKEILSRFERGELVYYGEGIGGFTAVHKDTDPLGNNELVMFNSGKADASSRGDMKTQTLLAHFPMLFNKNPKSVMVLGLASGITAGEVLHYPVERLDIVEISKKVVEASDLFIPWNNNVLADSRTRLIIQDGRAHLNLTERKYNVIISEPSNPWMAGLAALFTYDFFKLVRERLHDDGTFVQWIHSYQMDWPTFSLVGRTFAKVFPNSLLIVAKPSTEGGDYLLVGFKNKDRIALDIAKQNIPYAERSKNVVLTDPELLFRLIVSEDLESLFGRGPINTDSRPRLEFAAPMLINRYDPTIRKNVMSAPLISKETKQIVRNVSSDIDSQIDFAAYALSVHEPFQNMINLRKASPRQKDRFLFLIDDYCSNNILDESLIEDDEIMQRCQSAQMKRIKDHIDQLPNKALSYAYLAELHLKEGRLDEAVKYYLRSLEIQPLNAAAHNDLGVALVQLGREEKALKHFKEALRIDPEHASAKDNIEYVLKRREKKSSPSTGKR